PGISPPNDKDKLPGPPAIALKRGKPGWRPRSASAVGYPSRVSPRPVPSTNDRYPSHPPRDGFAGSMKSPFCMSRMTQLLAFASSSKGAMGSRPPLTDTRTKLYPFTSRSSSVIPVYSSRLPWARVGPSHSADGNADRSAAATDSGLPSGRYSDSATSAAGRRGPRIRRMTASQLTSSLERGNDKDKLPGRPRNLHAARNQDGGPSQLHPLVSRAHACSG